MTIDVQENSYATYLAELAKKQNETPAEFKTAKPRVYWHRHNYAKFHFDMSPWRQGVKSISFANFRYVTDDKREQDQLDLVVNQPGTMIYSVADNEARMVFENELRMQQREQVLQAAQATASAHNQIFDGNVPIQPVLNATPTISPIASGLAITGTQNTLSGTAAVELPNNPVLTTAAMQIAPPTAQVSASAQLMQELAARGLNDK